MAYDSNGNATLAGFTFDEFDQLVVANGETILYDGLGRRLQKGSTSYLYFGDEEAGAYEQGEPKELQVPGIAAPIAIEIDRQPYFPIADVQDTIRLLIDPATSAVCRENSCDPFGVNLSGAIPYAYAGKRYDSESGLVYFGKRYYHPALGRWLTPDPIGPLDHSNLYQYVFNNPFRYRDPNGEFAFAIPLVIWGAELALPAISALVYGAAAGAIIYGTYKVGEAIQGWECSSIEGYYSIDSMYKSGSVDPSLPANPDDLLKRPGWKETTHPDAGKKGHRTFENKETGEKLRHDEGRPNESGHEKYSHYHRPNPNKSSKHDEYLDHNHNPVGRHSDASHLYSPENIWW